MGTLFGYEFYKNHRWIVGRSIIDTLATQLPIESKKRKPSRRRFVRYYGCGSGQIGFSTWKPYPVQFKAFPISVRVGTGAVSHSSDASSKVQRNEELLIDKEINPYVDEWESRKSFPARDLFKKLGSLGIFGVNKPVDFGGLGLDFSYSVAIGEEIGRINCGAIPMAIAVQSDMATPALAKYGSDYLKKYFLEPSLQGEFVACLGVSEECAGSDVAAIRTWARRDGDDLIIDGSKKWITNGCQADWICLLANTNQNGSFHRNKSLICVPLNEKACLELYKSLGIHRSKPIEKLGMHASDTAELFFDSVRVSRKNIIGEEGRGFVYQMEQFQDERMIATAVSLEPLQRIIDLTIDYAKGRNIFGRKIIDNQVIHYKLAELQTEIELLRSLLYRAVLERIKGEDVTLLASMCKLKSARLAREITDSCLQFWGGNGYTWENPISRSYRDFRVFSIGAGCDEVMLSIICKHMGTMP